MYDLALGLLSRYMLGLRTAAKGDPPTMFVEALGALDMRELALGALVLALVLVLARELASMLESWANFSGVA